MPLLSFRFPEKFKQKFPEKYRNFKINQNRLISDFDVHETLEEIMDITLGEETHPMKSKHGISLFHEISKNRSCLDALIPSVFCTCMEPTFDKNLEAATVGFKPEFQLMNLMFQPQIEKAVEAYIGSATNKSCLESITFQISEKKEAWITSDQLRSGAKSFEFWTTLKTKPINDHVFEIAFDVDLNLTARSEFFHVP